MAVVQLRDIVTEADRAAVLTLRRGPGQERYLGSMESHFEDAVTDAKARPRIWSVHDGELLVGFVMISDGIPLDVLAADDDIVGPYFLWRLLIDERYQGRGYGAATIDAVVAYLRTPRRRGPVDELRGRSRLAPTVLPALRVRPDRRRQVGRGSPATRPGLNDRRRRFAGSLKLPQSCGMTPLCPMVCANDT